MSGPNLLPSRLFLLACLQVCSFSETVEGGHGGEAVKSYNENGRMYLPMQCSVRGQGMALEYN